MNNMDHATRDGHLEIPYTGILNGGWNNISDSCLNFGYKTTIFLLCKRKKY